MINPFRTRKILIVFADGSQVRIEIPLFGKINYVVEKNPTRGHKFEAIICNEVVRRKYV